MAVEVGRERQGVQGGYAQAGGYSVMGEQARGTCGIRRRGESIDHCAFAAGQERARDGGSLGGCRSAVVVAQALPAVLTGEDVVLGAETGSGKTLAYLLPVIHALSQQPPPRCPPTSSPHTTRHTLTHGLLSGLRRRTSTPRPSCCCRTRSCANRFFRFVRRWCLRSSPSRLSTVRSSTLAFLDPQCALLAQLRRSGE